MGDPMIAWITEVAVVAIVLFAFATVMLVLLAPEEEER